MRRNPSCHLRHRKTWRYWKTEKWCFRGNLCQYLHLDADKYEHEESQTEHNIFDENEIKQLKSEIENLTVENKNEE